MYGENTVLRVDQIQDKVPTPPFVYILTFFSAIGGFLFGWVFGSVSHSIHIIPCSSALQFNQTFPLALTLSRVALSQQSRFESHHRCGCCFVLADARQLFDANKRPCFHHTVQTKYKIHDALSWLSGTTLGSFPVRWSLCGSDSCSIPSGRKWSSASPSPGPRSSLLSVESWTTRSAGSWSSSSPVSSSRPGRWPSPSPRTSSCCWWEESSLELE